jgi:murein DD-endopeptidase MepM/ murein hydrolase activator NlpD
VAFIEGRAGMTMTDRIDAARTNLVRGKSSAFMLRRIGAVLAAFLFIAAPALAGAVTRGSAPATQARNSDPQYHALFTIWRDADRPVREDFAIPSGSPVGSANLTSGFGIRSDPFRASAAMHPGIDLAAPLGTPVYATADGVVDRSEWNNGGYGNLIEIDHGQGIQTRYGHLSQRIAEAGQVVHRGDLIGLMGSTGRSTGSHLHYEVRIDGKAVNPVPFLQSTSYLQSVQQRAAAATRLANGGPAAAN